MNSLLTVYHWVTQYPFTATVVFVGGAMVAVMLYTYVYDYKMLTNLD